MFGLEWYWIALILYGFLHLIVTLWFAAKESSDFEDFITHIHWILLLWVFSMLFGVVGLIFVFPIFYYGYIGRDRKNSTSRNIATFRVPELDTAMINTLISLGFVYSEDDDYITGFAFKGYRKKRFMICADGRGRYNGDPTGSDLALLKLLKNIKSEKQNILNEIESKERYLKIYKETAAKNSDISKKYKKEIDDLKDKLKQLES